MNLKLILTLKLTSLKIMFSTLKKEVIFCLIFLLSIQGFSQISRHHNRLRNTREFLNHERLGIYGSIGLSSYYGDLCDKYKCMQFRPNLGIGAMLRLTSYLGIKTELNYYRLYSKDIFPQRNLDFRSGNAEFYVSGYAQLFPYTKYQHIRKKFNAYAFLGIGVTYFNPKGSLNGKWYNLRKMKTEGVAYSPFALMIPFGAGVTYKVSKHWDIMVEFGYRKTFTDRLDDVSSREWRPLSSFSNPIAAQLSNKTGQGDNYWLKTHQPRGNPNRKDGYFISQIKFKYTIITRRTHYRLRRSPLRKRF